MSEQTRIIRQSDVKWYVDNCLGDAGEYCDLFLKFCKKFGVSLSKATEREKKFVEEVTRVTFERNKAIREGTPLSEIRPAFE